MELEFRTDFYEGKKTRKPTELSTAGLISGHIGERQAPLLLHHTCSPKKVRVVRGNGKSNHWKEALSNVDSPISNHHGD